MYAVSNESPEVAALEATRLVELGVRHVSAYSLTIEPGTRFGQLARKGRLPLSDDAQMAASFFAIDEALEKLGLEHYEVSNYAAARRALAPQPRLLGRARLPRSRVRRLRHARIT